MFRLSAKHKVLASLGATQQLYLDRSIDKALPFETRGENTLELSAFKASVAWRTLDNGDVVMVAAPAEDFYQRTPIWFAYALILTAITLVMASLMAAFVRQSRAAVEAAGAIDALRRHPNRRCAPARASAWHYDDQKRMVVLSRSFLEPLGFGDRDRYFTLQEILRAGASERSAHSAVDLYGRKRRCERRAQCACACRAARGPRSFCAPRIRLAATGAAAGVAFDMTGARTPGPRLGHRPKPG